MRTIYEDKPHLQLLTLIQHSLVSWYIIVMLGQFFLNGIHASLTPVGLSCQLVGDNCSPFTSLN